MKYIITENQLERLSQEEKILELPSLLFFNNDWNLLQTYLERKGNPKYSIEGDLDLRGALIKSLGNLTSVGGDLDLSYSPIKSLGNLTSVGGGLNLRGTQIKSLGNLNSVGDYLNLAGTKIESLENLTSVGGYLGLSDTSLSKMYTEEEIRNMVEVTGKIYM
jgi:hypothetical protein